MTPVVIEKLANSRDRLNSRLEARAKLLENNNNAFVVRFIASDSGFCIMQTKDENGEWARASVTPSEDGQISDVIKYVLVNEKTTCVSTGTDDPFPVDIPVDKRKVLQATTVNIFYKLPTSFADVIYYLVAFFLFATVFLLPFLVRELFFVR